MGLRNTLDFRWSAEKNDAALQLAEGRTKREVAANAGVSETTIYNWLSQPEFSQEVDRLSLMVEMASRAARMRLANRVIRQLASEEEIKTNKDLLEWLRYTQSETDGVKLGLSEALSEAVASMAGGGSEDTD